MGIAESKKKFDLQEEEEEYKFQTIDCSKFKYTGNTKNNLFHGEGEYQRIVDNKIHYTVYGVWENHNLISYKIVYDLSGNIYEGEIDTREYVAYAYSNYGGNRRSLPETVNYKYFDYRPHGKGKMYHPDGSCHLEGTFNQGLFTGYGKKKDITGNMYIGNWVDDLYHGEGKLIKKIVDRQTNKCKFLTEIGLFHSGHKVEDEEKLTDEVRELFFSNMTELSQETQETQETLQVQPDAPEAEQEGEQEQEPEGELVQELEEQEEEQEEVGESEDSEIEEPNSEQKNIQLSKIQLAN